MLHLLSKHYLKILTYPISIYHLKRKRYFLDKEQLAISGLGLEIDQGYITELTSIEDTLT